MPSLGRFLSASNARLIKRDFKLILAGPGAVDIALLKSVITGGAYNPAYRVYENFSGNVVEAQLKAIVEFIKPFNRVILDFGILQVGDCIFYTDPDITKNLINLTANVDTTNYLIRDSFGVIWTPKLTDAVGFNSYLRNRVGNLDYSQVIPCTKAQPAIS